MSMIDKIKEASKEFGTEDSFIVNYFDGEGRDFDEEYFTLEAAVEGLLECWGNYETFNGGSINSLMAEPTMSHPDGSGKMWDFYSCSWSQVLVTDVETRKYDLRGKDIGKLSTPGLIVSHGVDMDTGENVCLPQEELHSFNPVLIKGENYLL